MINKHTSYIIVIQCWKTAAREYPTVMENGRHCKKKRLKIADPNQYVTQKLVVSFNMKLKLNH